MWRPCGCEWRLSLLAVALCCSAVSWTWPKAGLGAGKACSDCKMAPLKARAGGMLSDLQAAADVSLHTPAWGIIDWNKRLEKVYTHACCRGLCSLWCCTHACLPAVLVNVRLTCKLY